MPSLTKKLVFLAALTAAFLLFLTIFFTVRAPVPHALQVSILGQTNDPSGAPMSLVGVTNHTGQARFFYLSTIVPCPSGWTSANQRCQKRTGWRRTPSAGFCCGHPQGQQRGNSVACPCRT